VAIKQQRQLLAIEIAEAEQENAICITRLTQAAPRNLVVEPERLGLVALAYAFHHQAAGFHHPQRRQSVQRGESLLAHHTAQHGLMRLAFVAHLGGQVVVQDFAQNARGLKPLVIQMRQAAERRHRAGLRVEAIILLELVREFAG